ncbi:hypothetical protein FGIG_11274 [Fasciola gigantica]|uniref:BAR domain-containing protein n=1 Tax=Fasciola gigantica TaxID=46835 RepID=A0A504YSA9_FASGI|nr:hypothetical protein FGIG_11274 [Fasciola gigantica]
MPIDPASRHFQSMTAELEQVISAYKKLFHTEEQFPSLFNKTEAFNHSFIRPLSSAILIIKEAQDNHEKFQQLDSQFFLPPLKKISDMLPAVSKLITEREQIVKDLDKSVRKCMKLELTERTGENLAKLSKHRKMIDYLNTRKDTIDGLFAQILPELTAKTEAFVGRLLRAHLNWKYQSSLSFMNANNELAGIFRLPEQYDDLAGLENDMNEAMEEIHHLSLVRRKA